MTIVQISKFPLIEIGSGGNPKFPGRESKFISVKVDDDNEIYVHSGYVFEGFFEKLINELKDLQNQKRDSVGYGGSGRDFSVTFSVTRTVFSLVIHNFGEPLNYKSAWPITFELSITR